MDSAEAERLLAVSCQEYRFSQFQQKDSTADESMAVTVALLSRSHIRRGQCPCSSEFGPEDQHFLCYRRSGRLHGLHNEENDHSKRTLAEANAVLISSPQALLEAMENFSTE